MTYSMDGAEIRQTDQPGARLRQTDASSCDFVFSSVAPGEE